MAHSSLLPVVTLIVCQIGLFISVDRTLGEEPARSKVNFEEHVLPIFKAHCVKCHAGAEPAGELRLTTRKDILRGGRSGAAIRLAAAESSLLWEKLAANEMPKQGTPLSPVEKGMIREWINNGAPSANPKDDVADEAASDSTDSASEHWSFRPPVRPSIPRVSVQAEVANPIDAFLMAKLAEQNLSYSPEAEKAVLMRRAAFDLIGLPPSPEELQAFLDDRGDDAYERMIERLLANPHYGERWGRYWLDLAGYAESAGVLSEDRPINNHWRYRDYVCRAFNSDKPYDLFLQEQIAGDELYDYWGAYDRMEKLPEQVIEGITATGFLRCAPDSSRPDFSTIKNADAQYFYPTINDTMQIVSSATMGLTLQCARCHSHKYDPIPQVDFYRVQAIFMSAFRPKQWVPQMDRKLPIATAVQKKSADERNAQLGSQIEAVKNQIAASRKEFKQTLFDDRLATLPEPIRADVSQALMKAADQRTEVEKYLAEKFQPILAPADDQLDKILTAAYPPFKTLLSEKNQIIARHEQEKVVFEEIRALYDLPGPVETPLLRRGDALTPGSPVEPGVVAALNTPAPFQWTPPSTEVKTSGRRLAFARWLTQPQHPLTSRVMVNRIWMHHFGSGIVTTPEDFGALGSAPSHPELLDWLAREFVDKGWSIKQMHRLMMNSFAYRQRSNYDERHHAEAQRVDPDNRLLWRQRMRRLDAESLRDSFLETARLLDARFFGESVRVQRQADGEVTVGDPRNDRRRSIYLQVLRSNPLTLLHLHDQPVMETNCTRRSQSTVSPQALTLLNSEIVLSYARTLAERALKQAPAAPVGFVVKSAWSRDPTTAELAAAESFLEMQTAHYASQAETRDAARLNALADICQMILVSNEFVYVD